jgi:hypothetical protein
MQFQTEATSWNTVKTQIAGPRAIGGQIEDVRSLLAEDWQVRVSRPAVSAIAAVNYRCPPDVALLDTE